MIKVIFHTFLVLIGLCLWVLLVPLGFIYGLGRGAYKRQLGAWLLACAVSINQSGNTFCCYLFNDCLLISQEAVPLFGDPDITISHVLGLNKRINNLSGLGQALAAFLNFLDPYHVEDAANNPQ